MVFFIRVVVIFLCKIEMIYVLKLFVVIIILINGLGKNS